MSDNKSFQENNGVNNQTQVNNQAGVSQGQQPYGRQCQQGPGQNYGQGQGQYYGQASQSPHHQEPMQRQNPYDNQAYRPSPNGQVSGQQDPLAITSMVLGIVSLLFVFIQAYAFLGCLTGIAGVVLGIVSRKKNGPSTMATAGLIMSAIAVGLCIIITIACAACAATMFSVINSSY